MLKKKKWEKLFIIVADVMRQDNSGMCFEVYDDNDELFGFAISVLSTGPDYAPDVQKQLPPGWRFLGWKNLDQRNNLSSIVMRHYEPEIKA